MNKKETAEILAMLSSYYAERRNADPKRMVEDWHRILADYDFKDIERAVMHFAMNDQREVPIFPVPSQIISGLDTIGVRERRVLNSVVNALMMGNYEALEADGKRFISKADFNRVQSTWNYYDMATKRKDLESLVMKLHWERGGN